MNEERVIHSGANRKALTKNCQWCSTPFTTRADWIDIVKFCSRKCCSEASRIPRPKLNCATCGNPVERTPAKAKKSKSGIFFCSNACRGKAQKLGGIKEIQPSHYGTREEGYREIYLKNGGKLKCIRCGYDEFPCGVEIHHKDENRDNNSVENLVALCANCHRGLHCGFCTI